MLTLARDRTAAMVRWRPSSLSWFPEAVVGYYRYPYMKFGGRS
jgi:hypothetical protein